MTWIGSLRSRAGHLPGDREGLRRALSTELLPVYFDALEDTGEWEVRALRVSQWVARQWAGRGAALEPLLEVLNAATDDILDAVLARTAPGSPEARRCARRAAVLGARFVTEVASEYERTARRRAGASGGPVRTEETAMRALLGDDSHSGPMVHFLAGTYAMVAVRLPGASPHFVEEAFHAHGGPGTLCLLGNGGGHVLMPGRGPSAARAAAQQVYERLGRVGWFLVDKGTADQLPARRERADTLLVVASALYDAGVYEFRDMMTEYAAATSPETATRLIHLIDPVLRRPVLRRTLATLIATRGDRSRAAERLNVHRSLLDQWLQRVEVLTGMRIESAKSFAVLASALAAHAVRTSPENAARA